ncbi:MAG: hypothetical protein PVG83_01680 [Acidimicrobiia bacterium]|jgi:hypothetical protein
MYRDVDIKGGAGEMEAAVIAVVLDRINREEIAARQGRGDPRPGLPAWVTAIRDWDEADTGFGNPSQSARTWG